MGSRYRGSEDCCPTDAAAAALTGEGPKRFGGNKNQQLEFRREIENLIKGME